MSTSPSKMIHNDFTNWRTNLRSKYGYVDCSLRKNSYTKWFDLHCNIVAMEGAFTGLMMHIVVELPRKYPNKLPKAPFIAFRNVFGDSDGIFRFDKNNQCRIGAILIQLHSFLFIKHRSISNSQFYGLLRGCKNYQCKECGSHWDNPIPKPACLHVIKPKINYKQNRFNNPMERQQAIMRQNRMFLANNATKSNDDIKSNDINNNNFNNENNKRVQNVTPPKQTNKNNNIDPRINPPMQQNIEIKREITRNHNINNIDNNGRIERNERSKREQSQMTQMTQRVNNIQSAPVQSVSNSSYHSNSNINNNIGFGRVQNVAPSQQRVQMNQINQNNQNNDRHLRSKPPMRNNMPLKREAPRKDNNNYDARMMQINQRSNLEVPRKFEGNISLPQMTQRSNNIENSPVNSASNHSNHSYHSNSNHNNNNIVNSVSNSSMVSTQSVNYTILFPNNMENVNNMNNGNLIGYNLVPINDDGTAVWEKAQMCYINNNNNRVN